MTLHTQRPHTFVPCVQRSRHLLRCNRGALFGIDARLALVIFAALSTGIGYYSMGKINQARTAAFIKELQHAATAVEQMQTDLGTFLPYTLEGGSNGTRDFEVLYNRNHLKPGYRRYWNGPYFMPQNGRQHPRFGQFSISYGTAERNPCTDRKTQCYVWLTLTDVPAAVWDDVNSYIDENGGTLAEPNPQRQGKIMGDSLTDTRTLFYRAAKRP